TSSPTRSWRWDCVRGALAFAKSVSSRLGCKNIFVLHVFLSGGRACRQVEAAGGLVVEVGADPRLGDTIGAQLSDERIHHPAAQTLAALGFGNEHVIDMDKLVRLGQRGKAVGGNETRRTSAGEGGKDVDTVISQCS